MSAQLIKQIRDARRATDEDFSEVERRLDDLLGTEVISLHKIKTLVALHDNRT